MPILRVSLLGAVLSLLPVSVAPSARAEPARELVVALAPARPGTAARESRAALNTRIEALGLRVRESLASRLPPAGLPLPGVGATLRVPAPGVGTGPFDLDPERIWLLEAPDPSAAAAALETLLADPGVEWAEPNRVREIAALRLDPPPVPDDPLLRDGRQWGLRNLGPASPWGGVAGADIRALEAWARCSGSNDLLLAVADTGIDPAHPDLAATLPDGSPRIAYAANLTGLEPADAIADSNYHGTGVAGVIAARTNDGPHFDSLGMAGVCGGDGRGNFGCRLVPIKISPYHSGSASSYTISAAMLYATAVGARAMNLSYAGEGPSRLERLAMHSAITHGCVVVAAAGNSGYPGPGTMYPAAYAADGLGIQVGATDRFDQRTYWSSWGPDMDLMAPGLDIWTTYMTYPNAVGTVYPGYVAETGTSFAAPFVTGAVGLLAAARPELTDVDFKHVLRESAHDIGDPGVDAQTGWGRLDAAAALDAVGPDVGIWHDEVAGQSFRTLESDTLQVNEGGFGTLGHWSGRHAAQLIEVTTRLALPDSFLGPVRVWPRLGGTTTVRGGWSLPYFVPWAEVAEWNPPGTTLPGAARAFTLRGYLYHMAAAGCPDCAEDGYVPLPPTQMRFGFTVLGRVDRPPTVTLLAPAPGVTLAPGDTLTVRWTATDPDEVTTVGVDLVQSGRPPLALARVAAGTGAGTTGVTIPCAAWPGGGALRVTAHDDHGARRDQASADVAVQVRAGPCNGAADAALRLAPNPFRGALRISGPAGTRVTIFDLSGRRRRTAVLDDGGAFSWDGRDDAGHAVASGLYFARAGSDTRLTKLVRIE